MLIRWRSSYGLSTAVRPFKNGVVLLHPRHTSSRESTQIGTGPVDKANMCLRLNGLQSFGCLLVVGKIWTCAPPEPRRGKVEAAEKNCFDIDVVLGSTKLEQ